MSEGAVTVRTRKLMRNALLGRRQMVSMIPLEWLYIELALLCCGGWL